MQLQQILAPPITTVFVLGVFWKRGTKQAALTTLIFGFTLGAIAFSIDLPMFGDTKIITDAWGIHFMMQAWWLFCICTAVFVAVSLITPKPAKKILKALLGIALLDVIRGKIDWNW